MEPENEQQRRADVVRQRLSRRLGNEATSSTAGRRLRYTTPSVLTASRDGYPLELADARSSRRQLSAEQINELSSNPNNQVIKTARDLDQAFEKIVMVFNWPNEILKEFGSLKRVVEMTRFSSQYANHEFGGLHDYMYRHQPTCTDMKGGTWPENHVTHGYFLGALYDNDFPEGKNPKDIIFRLEKQVKKDDGHIAIYDTVYHNLVKETGKDASWEFAKGYNGRKASFGARLIGINKLDNVEDGPVSPALSG